MNKATHDIVSSSYSGSDLVASRMADWERLELLLDKIENQSSLKEMSNIELNEVSVLYRRTSSDLIKARSQKESEIIVRRLNALVGRAYAALYQSDTKDWKGLLHYFQYDVPQAFRRRIKFVYFAIFSMLLGALVGYVVVAINKQNIYVLLPPGNMLHDSVQYWESGQVEHAVQGGANAAASTSLMQNNITVSIVAFAFGIAGGIFTFYSMFFNGAVLGGMAALMTHVHQHRNFWPSILPHGIVELSATCFAGAAGFSLGWAVLSPGKYSRRDAIGIAARDSVKILSGIVVMLIFAGLVEGFISHSLLPKPLKIIFGITSGIALYLYLYRSGLDDLPPPMEGPIRSVTGS